MFPKKRIYHMDIHSADTTLQNIFAACDQTPNTIPFDKLILRQKARTKTYDILLIVITSMIILTILSPLPFLHFKKPMVYSPITITEHHIEDNELLITLDIGDHSVKYEKAYLLSNSGDIYEVISFDEKTHTLCFPYTTQECNIYIPYDENSLLHLLLTPNTTKEND